MSSVTSRFTSVLAIAAAAATAFVPGVACSTQAVAVLAEDAGSGDSDAATTPRPDSGSSVDGSTQEGCVLSAQPYDGANYAANAASALRLRAQYAEFTKLLKAVEAGTATATTADLLALFNTGTPSLRSATAPAFAARIDAAIDTFVAVSASSYVPSEPAPLTGGKYGAYLFSADGVDLRQAIEKGMYGATFYRLAAELLSAPFTLQTIDQLVALFGAHPTFPGNDADPNHPDTLAATYAERRDRKEPAKPGLYLRFKNAATRAQQAITAGERCAGEQASAMAELRLAWESAISATNIFYLNDAGGKLDASDASKWPAALHSYGEVLAFTDGFRYVPKELRRVSDAQIDALLTTLRLPPGQAAKAYSFALGTGDASSTFTLAISSLVTVYGFSANDVETFKTNF